MALSKKRTLAVERLLRASRQRTNKPRVPWHQQTIRKKATLSSAEKAALKNKRKEEKQRYHDALANAWAVVLQQATILKDQFGTHSLQYYFEEIMQQARLQQGSRTSSHWNAFLHKEVKRINDSQFILFFLFILFLLF